MLEPEGDEIGGRGIGKEQEVTGLGVIGPVDVENMAAEILKEHAAERAGHAAHADDRSDDVARKHVGDRGEEIGRPRLMRGADQADNEHGGPVARQADGQDREHEKGVAKQSRLARARHGPAMPDEIARQVAADQAEHGDDRVDGHEVRPARLDVEVARLFEIIG